MLSLPPGSAAGSAVVSTILIPWLLELRTDLLVAQSPHVHLEPLHPRRNELPEFDRSRERGAMVWPPHLVHAAVPVEHLLGSA